MPPTTQHTQDELDVELKRLTDAVRAEQDEIDELRAKLRTGRDGSTQLAAMFAVLLALAALLAVAFKLNDNQNSAVMPMMGSGSGAVATGSTPAAPATASISLVHVTNGCHTWVINGASTPTGTLNLASGGTLTITDNDVMPHRLVLTSGSGAQITGANMTKMGAQSSITFPKPGVYSFTTKAGEDYTSGIETVGPDNHLRLKVVVS